MSDSTKVLLNIEDKNVFIDEVVRDDQAMQVKAHLTYVPKACSECGVLNQHSIIKYGWRTVHVRLPKTGEWAVVMHLRKQYYECHACRGHFLAHTSIVKRNCSISYNTHQACLSKLNESVSMKHIAQELNTSPNFVSRVLNHFSSDFKTDYHHLPAALHIDEIKSTKDAQGSMSCVLMDGDHQLLRDILDVRTLPALTRYFKRYDLEVRNQVRFLVTDMNYTYPQLTEEIFPNAIVIIDRFHIINAIQRGLNKTRIEVMKQFATSSREYKALKKYWKLLLKPAANLDYKNFHRFSQFKYFTTEVDVIDNLLSLSPELAQVYAYAQRLCGAVRTHDVEELRNALADSVGAPETFETCLTYIREHPDYIENTLRHKDYSNGPLEGTNNRIKVLKRSDYGYTRFKNFRLRVLVMLRTKTKHPIIK
ncbi:ISL3 family transposase [Furfurilactobacillus cerevisiae]